MDMEREVESIGDRRIQTETALVLNQSMNYIEVASLIPQTASECILGRF